MTTIYLHFEDKTDLLFAVVDGGYADFSRRLQAAYDSTDDPLARIRALGDAYVAARPNYPFFLYDLADKRVILESVQAVLDAGAQRLYTGHGGPLPRQAVAEWLEKQHQQARSGR